MNNPFRYRQQSEILYSLRTGDSLWNMTAKRISEVTIQGILMNSCDILCDHLEKVFSRLEEGRWPVLYLFELLFLKLCRKEN